MSYRLFVRPVSSGAGPDAHEQLYSWALCDASGGIQARGAGDTREQIELVLAQNALEEIPMIALIPGQEVLFCLADIPVRQSRYIAQALPYAVEEQIAQDIETVHLALGEHTPEGYRVAAIDRERMAHWFGIFSGWAGTRLTAIFPDAALLPVTAGGWTVCLDGDVAMLMSERGEWLNIHPDNLGMLAQALAAPSEEEVSAQVPVTVYAAQEELDAWQAVLAELQAPGRLAVHQEILEVTPLELLVHTRQQQLCQPINLCQGAFAVGTGGTGLLRPWKPVIVVASFWFVIQVALEIGMGFYYRHQANTLEQQAMAIYRQAFPDDRRTHAGNVRRVIEGQLRVAGSGGPQLDFINLMKFTGQQYSQLSSPEAVLFNSVNYSRNRGELVVDLRADNYERLNALRNGLASQGLEAQIGSVVNEDGGTRGRLTVSGG